MYDTADPQSLLSTLTPIQGLPGAAQLDMNVSCLFMHEVRFVLLIKYSYFVFFLLLLLLAPT